MEELKTTATNRSHLRERLTTFWPFGLNVTSLLLAVLDPATCAHER